MAAFLPLIRNRRSAFGACPQFQRF